MTNIIVCWFPPPPGWIKVHTDGTTQGAPAFDTCGGIFRTCRGFVKGCFWTPSGISFAFEPELMGFMTAIKKVFEFN